MLFLIELFLSTLVFLFILNLNTRESGSLDSLLNIIGITNQVTITINTIGVK